VDSRKIPINTKEASSSRTNASEDTAEFRVVDKRPFAQMDPGAPITEPMEVKPRYPTYVEELMAKVTETERRFSERVKQVDQEIARSKNRLEAEFERRLALAKQHILLPFLDVLDNLERALKAATAGGSKEDLLQGLRITTGLFRAKLKAHAIEPIEVINRPFDPNVSQAVGVVPVLESSKDGIVIEEVLPGYRMENSLVRPAQVRVGQYQQDKFNPA
jgi:molecular chaperone GrpE